MEDMMTYTFPGCGSGFHATGCQLALGGAEL